MIFTELALKIHKIQIILILACKTICTITPCTSISTFSAWSSIIVISLKAIDTLTLRFAEETSFYDWGTWQAYRIIRWGEISNVTSETMRIWFTNCAILYIFWTCLTIVILIEIVARFTKDTVIIITWGAMVIWARNTLGIGVESISIFTRKTIILCKTGSTMRLAFFTSIRSIIIV